MSEHTPEQLNNLVELVKQSRDPHPRRSITLNIEVTPQVRDNSDGLSRSNAFYTAACQEEPGINGYGETRREALADLLESLGLMLACNPQNMELDKVLEEGG